MKEETTTPKKLLSPKGAIVISEQLVHSDLSTGFIYTGSIDKKSHDSSANIPFHALFFLL